MKHSMIALVTVVALTGCGAVGNPVASKNLPRTLAIREAGKPVVDPPAPAAPKQGFTKSDVISMAGDAYAQAFNTKNPEDAQRIARAVLTKIAAMRSNTELASDVVPYALAVMKADVRDAESARRLALWPLYFISQGLDNANSPQFFQLSTKVMESMLNWKDGLAVGLVTLDVLKGSENEYIKKTVSKELENFKKPDVGAQEGYNSLLSTLKEIGQTLVGPKKH